MEEGAQSDGTYLMTLSPRQAALMRAIRDLNPDLRHTLEIEFRGIEPWKVTSIKEHMSVDLNMK